MTNKVRKVREGGRSLVKTSDKSLSKSSETFGKISSRTSGKASGFTIIEVALVLAIAALIFLVVFLAVPALQRNQRDDGRRRDISSVVSAATTYYSNMNKWWPDTGTCSADEIAYDVTPKNTSFGKYLDTMSNGIDKVVAKCKVNTLPANWKPAINEIFVWPGLKCGTAPGLVPVVGTARTAAVIGQLESGSSSYCQNVN